MALKSDTFQAQEEVINKLQSMLSEYTEKRIDGSKLADIADALLKATQAYNELLGKK